MITFRIIPKTFEDYLSVAYDCVRFIDSYRFLSSSLDKLGKTLVDNSHETMKDLKQEIVDNDEILNAAKEIKTKSKEIRYNNDSNKDLKRDYPDKIENLEEALLNYIGEFDLKISKTEFPEIKWKNSIKKLA